MKILILGGGGVYGMLHALWLWNYQLLDVDGEIKNNIDVIGGTSSGALVALALALGKKPEEIYYDFMDKIEYIFDKKWYRMINPFLPRYSTNGIENFLKSYFVGEFGDIKNIKVVIPSLRYDTYRPKVFDNIVESEDLHKPIWEIARATTSAPFYFHPLFDEQSGAVFIDGGIMENIPILTTVSAIKDKMGISYSDMHVFAIGTGFSGGRREIKKVKKYTWYNWFRAIAKFTTESNQITSDFWAKNMGFASYTYFNPLIHDGQIDSIEDLQDGIIETLSWSVQKQFDQKWKEFINA